MDDLLQRLRAQVEQSTTPIQVDEVEARGSAGRRSRLLNVAAVAALVLLVVGVVLARRDPAGTETVAVPEPAPVAVQAIEVDAAPDGTEEVVFVFDGPLPDDEATFVDDIEAVQDPSGLGYAVQSPSVVHVCNDRHFFGDVPDGFVDLLLPLAWFDPAADDVLQVAPTYGSGVEHAGKIVGCRAVGRGFVQLSIWGSPSDEPETVSVSVDPSRTRVTVEMRPAP